MFTMSSLFIGLHALAAVVWVGGMFFAYMILRPAAGALEPPQRLRLWDDVFRRFFLWVWIAVVALPATGYAQVFLDFGGFAEAGPHVQIMHVIAWVMIALFLFLYFVTYRAYRRAVADARWPDAGARLNTIRRIVATNMVLGLITAAIGASGRVWG
jgi:uncharacterized membrane protein